MEPHPRTSPRPDGLRPVNSPRPVEVETVDAQPQQIRFHDHGAAGPSHAVDQIDEVWRVVDEWWRPTPIERTYYRLTLDDDRLVTLFHDTVADRWFLQRY